MPAWSSLPFVLAYLLPLALLTPVAGIGGDKTPLPAPLTLEAALSSVDESHPVIALARARYQAALAQRDIRAAADDSALRLSLQARRVEPDPDSPYQDYDDSRALLTLDKT